MTDPLEEQVARAYELEPHEQHVLAGRIAANVGYELTAEGWERQRADTADLLVSLAQIIDVVKQEWTAAGSWSAWDQEQRDRITQWLVAYHADAQRPSLLLSSLTGDAE